MADKTIVLANERNEHCTKRLNRLSIWGFFKYLYNNEIWKMFGFNFLMLLVCSPLIIVYLWYTSSLGAFNSTLTYATNSGFGFGTGVWTGVTQYANQVTGDMSRLYGLIAVLGSLALCLMFSAGFAVIRDAFWTGKYSVFKSLWRGIKANICYAVVSALVIGLSVYGIAEVYNALSSVLWLAIIVLVLLCIVELFLVTYLMILCSVAVTYKQTFAQNMADSWHLLWLNVLPNTVHTVIALIPIGLFLLVGNGPLSIVVYTLAMMFGGMYFPHVWQTYMMKVFALFHPVATNKKGETIAEG